jgi:hypothetical protein
LAVGQANAALNQLADRVRFHQAWVGGVFSERLEGLCESDGVVRSLPCFDMKRVSELAGDRCIEVLHIDTQGAELPFISSMEESISRRQVRFVVVSTHHRSISGSPTTHEDCRARLIGFGARILAEHDVQQSFSGDGLIVASFFPEDSRLHLPVISLNNPHASLFPEP